MAFTNKIHISICIIFVLFIQTTFAQNTPLFSICSNSQNFISNSRYERNLNTVFRNLYLKTPRTGFSLSSTGRNPDKVYGLSLCRGDASIYNCRTCVAEASSEILRLCPNDKAAVVWYDNCYLKYSDIDFFGQIDSQNRFYMWNNQNVSNPDVFNQMARELLSNLSDEAIRTKRLFANGEIGMPDGSETIYGMAQCSRDLSIGDCRKCIGDAVSELPACCDGRQGGRIVGGSCNIRYEIYPFLYLN